MCSLTTFRGTDISHQHSMLNWLSKRQSKYPSCLSFLGQNTDKFILLYVGTFAQATWSNRVCMCIVYYLAFIRIYKCAYTSHLRYELKECPAYRLCHFLKYIKIHPPPITYPFNNISPSITYPLPQ